MSPRVGLLAGGLLLLVTQPAYAWVCARSVDANGVPSGPANGWSQTRQLTYTFNANGTTQLPVDDTFATVRQSFHVWETSQLRGDQDPNCTAYAVPGTPKVTDVVFVEQPPTTATNVGYNFLDPNSNENLIVFRDGGWPHADAITSTTDIIALTTTTYNQLTGEIFDADIEFNSASFTFTIDDNNISTDLMNTATHEVGHFLGFAHSTDANATMYYAAGPKETLKRYIACDDAAILWFRYPAGDPNMGFCEPNSVTPACGECAPPTPLLFEPTIRLVGTNDGLSRDFSCQSFGEAGMTMAAGVLIALVFRALRRRGQ